jgi:murein DD-endopeptidase MepM/ murein hydrolase activator NlpD
MPDVEHLRSRGLVPPLPGLDPRRLRDTFDDPRAGGARAHVALDIPAPRGTRVVAVEDGVVAKLFTSAGGGLTVYQFDASSTYCYYYAHLDGYAPGLREGQRLGRGDLVGFVGTTGNAPPGTPHLHFAIFRLGTPPRWWEGTPINPYPIWADPKPPL